MNEVFEKYEIAFSELSIIEFTSALRRKVAEKVITMEELYSILLKFNEDLGNFIVLMFDSDVISKATEC